MSELRPFSELTKDFTPERRQRIEAKKAELRAAMRAAEVPKVSYIEALGTRLKMIAEFLKGKSKYRLWAVPAAMASILAIVAYNLDYKELMSMLIVVQYAGEKTGDKDYEELKSMLANYEERRFMLAKSTDRQRELVTAHSAHATDKIRLLVGTEERIKEDGFPEADHHWNFLSIGERLDLKGKELKVLIGLSGKLKKGSDYQVEKSQGTTSITFTNDILSGQAVLVVVEAKN